jgi:hypothetical protein
MTDGLKVALVHVGAVLLGGAEKVLAELLEIWPEADVYTLVLTHRACAARLQGRRVETSFIRNCRGRCGITAPTCRSCRWQWNNST